MFCSFFFLISNAILPLYPRTPFIYFSKKGLPEPVATKKKPFSQPASPSKGDDASVESGSSSAMTNGGGSVRGGRGSKAPKPKEPPKEVLMFVLTDVRVVEVVSLVTVSVVTVSVVTLISSV